MTEIERIADQLRRAHEGDAWHGPAVSEILNGVSGSDAAARPSCGRHSIWELLGHISVWEKVVCRRVMGRSAIEPTPEENFPLISDLSEAAWERARQDADHVWEELRAAILGLSDASLDSPVPGKNYPFSIMLHGVVQHTLYHAGQMALLQRGDRRA